MYLYLLTVRYTTYMLQLSTTLLAKSVLSLRTGQPVATVMAAIFNPKNLKIEGFYCNDILSNKQLILLYQDIRETMQDGFVVDDYDVLAEPEELVRLQGVLDSNFELIGKRIETVSNEKVGKVSDYAVETETMYVQKLYATRSLFKSFTSGSLSIDRTQINEITDKRIVINDLLEDTKVTVPATVT